MAKGLGYMAAVAMMKPREASVPCPLCGREMEWEDVAWFCRSGPRRSGHGASFEPCHAQCTDEVRDRFMAMPRGQYGWEDGYQFYAEPNNGPGATHAIAVDAEDAIVAAAYFVRGGGGCTNFTVSPQGRESVDVVKFFSEGGEWIMAPWFE